MSNEKPEVSVHDQLNLLNGVYSLEDAEITVVAQMIEEIEAYQRHVTNLTAALFHTVGKYAGIHTLPPADAEHYGFGAIAGRMIVYDTRFWQIDPERGLVELPPAVADGDGSPIVWDVPDQEIELPDVVLDDLFVEAKDEEQEG